MTSMPLTRTRAVIVLVGFLGGAAIFLLLNQAFGGPTPFAGTARYRLVATLTDSQRLVKKSLVLVRGVRVGEVSDAQLNGGQAQITLAIDTSQTTVYRDATIRPGHRTLFGEAYVQLDPGHAAAGRLPSGTTLARRSVLPSVELDEALQALDRPTLAHLRSFVQTGSQVDADPHARTALNDTVAGFADVTEALRAFTGTIIAQRTDLTRLVRNGRTVLQTLATRETGIRELVTSTRQTSSALNDGNASLRQGLAEAHALQKSVQTTALTVLPFVRRATPTIARLTGATPALTAALTDLRPAAGSATAIIRELPAVRDAAVPTFRRLRKLAPTARALLPQLEPALRNLVPIVNYAAPYKREVLGFVTGGLSVRELTPDGYTRYETSDTVKNFKPFTELGKDGAPYGWARFFAVTNSPSATQGKNTHDVGVNPYTRPGAPFAPFSGHYPQLQPAPRPAGR